jgi:hypothetical protein
MLVCAAQYISDRIGRAHIVGIAPGPYKMFAWESASILEPDCKYFFVDPYIKAGRQVHLPQNTNYSNTLASLKQQSHDLGRS